jgi:hypothetical protein
MIVRTIKVVFPSCRIFREDDATGQEVKYDFTNMVIFCKKTTSTPLSFRNPIKADFLGSKARESFLLPVHEVDTRIFEVEDASAAQILRAGNTAAIEAYSLQSAVGHWKIMRTVIPAVIWENW